MVRKNRKGNFQNKGGSRFPRRGNNRRSKIDFTGIRAIPSNIPRPAQDAPWNSIVIQRSVSVADSSAFTVNIQYIRDILANQLNLSSATNLQFRLLALDLYDLAARPFELASFNYTVDPTSVSNAQLNTAISWPGRNNWSRVKIVWPKAISAFPFVLSGTSAATNVVVAGTVSTSFGIVNVSTTSMLLRAHLLWRVNTIGPIPTLRDSGSATNFRSNIMSSIIAPDHISNGIAKATSFSLKDDQSERFARLGLHVDDSM